MCGIAPSPADNAWIVNINNGNSNWNNQNNEGFVRACAPRECQPASFRSLHTALRRARRGKRPSANMLAFESHWIDGLLDLEARLQAGTWSPGPTTCFVADAPKAREIHAPDFADRIEHHWLIPQLEVLWEPTFIHDLYSNRRGKGTHAAVERLKSFVKQVYSGEGGGHYLQLDVSNFFNSIHRPTLWAMLKPRMIRHGLSEVPQRAAHALLRNSPAAGTMRWACRPEQRETVPPHKRLENAAPGCGIAIGNLSSQFFANVYLDALDQFVKRILRVPRYLRYVDDFVLIHHDPRQLAAWRDEIEVFLRDRLRLELKADQRLRRLETGIDFLGYIVHPAHTLVRRRVVVHAREKLDAWARDHVRGGEIRATPQDLRAVTSVRASYEGHFRHANSYRLRQQLAARYPWLRAATARRKFDHRLEGRPFCIRYEVGI
ncbi:MAG TPA: reverse transcriptase domain-containing protein [Steroidobacteraceae bacterium]